MKELTGSGIGDYRPVNRIVVRDGKFVSKLYVGILLSMYSPEFECLNLFLVTRLSPEKDRVYGHFVDPKCSQNKRLPDDQEMCIWADMAAPKAIHCLFHTVAKGRLLKREVTLMVSRFAKSHGFSPYVVRSNTSLRRRAYREYLAILPSKVIGKSVRKSGKIGV